MFLTQVLSNSYLLGPYLASLNLDKLLLESEKGEKPEEKSTSKFGNDSDRSGGNR